MTSCAERYGEPRPLKVAVIREELVALTHDPMVAIVLNQLVYWSMRVKDFDLFLEEEKALNPDCPIPFRHGWIHKTAEKLIEETMLGVSHPTMRKYLKLLVEKGFVEERAHPQDKWNKTTQYRVNLRKLQADLLTLGYALQGFPLLLTCGVQASTKCENLSNERILHSDTEKAPSNEKNLHSEVKNLHAYTYTETTSENTNKDSSSSSNLSDSAREEEEEECEIQETKEVPNETSRQEVRLTPPDSSKPATMFEMWKTHTAQTELTLTDERRKKLVFLLENHLGSDLTSWETLCEKIKNTRFLMGGSPSGWRITLDWILNPINLAKIQESTFFDRALAKEEEPLNPYEITPARKTEVQAILDTIQDPVWKKLCSQLDFSTRATPYITSQNLKEIAKAWFSEIEDERFVMIGCPDRFTESRVEDLRFPLMSIACRTFPNVRAVLTRIEPPQNKDKPHAFS